MGVKYDHRDHGRHRGHRGHRGHRERQLHLSCLLRVLCVLCVLCGSPAFALAVEIEGVQPAALDQPRVHLHLRRDPKGPALSTGKGAEQTIDIEAFLDTGASGVMISKTTADALGVHRNTIAKRLRRAEAILGRPITSRPRELEAALLIAEVDAPGR